MHNVHNGTKGGDISNIIPLLLIRKIYKYLRFYLMISMG
jgi:hypothetical protein